MRLDLLLGLSVLNLASAQPAIIANNQDVIVTPGRNGDFKVRWNDGSECAINDICDNTQRNGALVSSLTSQLADQSSTMSAQSTLIVLQRSSLDGLSSLAQMQSQTISTLLSTQTILSQSTSQTCPSNIAATRGTISYPAENIPGSSARIGCESGFEADGTGEATCMRSGQWSSTTLSCSPSQPCFPQTLGSTLTARVAPDGATNINFVDLGQCFRSAGLITNISVYVARVPDSNLGKTFFLWRPTGQGRRFSLVSQIPYVAADAQVGQILNVTLQNPVNFQRSDCIGWRHQGPGVIPYSVGGDTLFYRYGEAPTVGTEYDFYGSGGGVTARAYSYEVIYTPDTC